MALESAPLRLRKSTILAKLEATNGTYESLAATDGDFNAYNAQFTPTLDGDDRERQGGFGHLKRATGPRSGRLTFDVDLTGSGTSGSVPEWASTLLYGCGMTASGGSFTFGSPTAEQTLSLGFYHEGRAHYIIGAQGTFTINKTAGRRGLVNFEFLGKLKDTADVALPTPTYPTTLPPRWVNGATAFGTTLRCATARIAANNELVLREDPNDDTGYRSTAIVSRRPTIVLDPESLLAATEDWLAQYQTGDTGAVSLVSGSSAGNIVTVSSAAAQIINIQQAERNRILVDEIEFLSTGDDLTIALT